MAVGLLALTAYLLPGRGDPGAHWPLWNVQVYWWGGQQAVRGGALYAPGSPFSFTYPPFAALVFVTAAGTSIGFLKISITVASLVALALLCGGRHYGRGTALVARRSSGDRPGRNHDRRMGAPARPPARRPRLLRHHRAAALAHLLDPPLGLGHTATSGPDLSGVAAALARLRSGRSSSRRRVLGTHPDAPARSSVQCGTALDR
jgi:hypothetical protein